MTLKSFKYAIAGIVKEMISGASFKLMIVVMSAVIAGGLILRITLTEWVILLMCSGGVLTAEMINTSIEAVVDMATDEHNPLAEKAKDIAAGAVLIASIFSVAVGAIIFLPYIFALF